MRLRRDQRGAALLEMAFTLPLLLLISVGIFEFGRAFEVWQVLTNAAREGARVAVLPGSRDAMVTARVQQYVQRWCVGYRRHADRDDSTELDNLLRLRHRIGIEGHGDLSVQVHRVAERRASSSSTVRRSERPFTMAASATMRNEN